MKTTKRSKTYVITSILLMLTCTLSAQWSPITNNNTWYLGSGGVGIGINAPETKLHIYNWTPGVANFIKLENVYSNTNTNHGEGIMFKGYYKQALISAFQNPQQNMGGDLQLQTYSDDNTLNTGIYLNKLGNVGIGSSSPNSRLEIKGSASDGSTVFNVLNSGGNSVFNIASNGAWNSGTGKMGDVLNVGFQAPNIITTNKSGVYAWAATSSPHYPNYADAGLSRGGVAMIYVGNGTAGNYSGTLIANNVGIGTTTPKTKLESVSGVNAYPVTSGNTQSGAALRLRGGDNAVLDFGMNSINTWIQATDQTALGYNYNISLNPNGGNVGIGTTKPNAKLDVGAFIDNNQLGTVLGRLAEGNQYGDGTYLGVKGYSTKTTSYDGKSFGIEHHFYGQTNSSINFYRGGSSIGGFITFNTNNNDEKMRIAANGNVGIGTGATEPIAKLDVNGKVFLRTFETIENWNRSYLNWAGHSLIMGSVKGDYSHNSIDLEPGGCSQAPIFSQLRMFTAVNETDHRLKIQFNTMGDCFINNGGNVGIGTDSPDAKLEVKDGSILINGFDATYTSKDQLGNTHQLIGTYQGWNKNAIYIAGYNNTNNPVFATKYVAFGGGGNEKMWIDLTSGKVNIGTTDVDLTKDVLLTVKGTIHAREVLIDLNAPLADYVFHPDYNLMPLAEVEQYVKTNNHLPEIPSATEVKDKGMNMGEMQNKLLQKIEELTLYMIEQQKRIDTQSAQIDELKKQIAK